MDNSTNDEDTIIVNVKIKQEPTDEDDLNTYTKMSRDYSEKMITLPKIISICSVHNGNSMENDVRPTRKEINPDEVTSNGFRDCPQDYDDKENSIQKVNVECPHCEVRISSSDFEYHVDFCSKMKNGDDTIQMKLNFSNDLVKSDRKHDLNESSLKSIIPSNSFASKENSEKLEFTKNKKDADLDRNSENNVDTSKSSQESDLLLWTETTLSCSKCSFTTDKQSTLIDHERRQHNTNEAIFQCFHCNQKYPRSMMATHIRNIHPHQKFQMVDENDQVIDISIKNEKNRHRRIQKTPITSKIVKRKTSLICSRCSYTTTRPDFFAKHKRVHLKSAPLIKCNWCDFKSTASAVNGHNRCCRKRIELLGRHEKSNNANSTHDNNCSVNGNNERSKIKEGSSLELRTRKGNTGSKTKVKCPHCCLITTHQYLKEHIVIHKRGVMNRKCNYCHFEAPGMTLLKHMMREHGKKIDTVESKAVAEPSDDKVSKPQYICYNCPYSTNFKMALYNHMKRHMRRKQKINKTIHSKTKIKNTVLSKPTDKSVDREIGNITSDEIETLKREDISTVADVTDESSCNAEGSINPILYCTQCTFSSNIQTEIEEHICKHYPSEFMKCKLCSLVGSKGMIARHNSSHVDKAVLKCRYCDFVSTKTALERHVIQHRRGGTGKQCEFCSAVFYGSNHMASHKMNQAITKCDTCEFKSTRATLAIHSSSCRIQKIINSLMKPQTQQKLGDAHITSHKEKNSISLSLKHEDVCVDVPESSAKELAFECELCSAKFVKASILLCHMRSHTNKSKMRKCSHCDFSSTFTLLRKHVNKTGHFSRRKRCLQCKSFFKRTKSSKKNKCPSCSTSAKHTFSNENDNSLERVCKDVNSQSGTQPDNFQCEICSFSTTLRIKLKVHMKKNHDSITHDIQNSNVKSSKKKVLLVCERCSFSTYNPSELKKHRENGHTDHKAVRSVGNVKIFNCNFCSFSTFWQYLLERHMHSHSVLKLPVAQCLNCNYRSTPAALAAHSNKCIKS